MTFLQSLTNVIETKKVALLYIGLVVVLNKPARARNNAAQMAYI